jgi:hypothetical protein
MPCPTCTRLERDEELLRSALEEREEALRFDLPEDVRGRSRTRSLLARIEERRAASVPS